MTSIPREGGVQSAVGLLHEGFPYIRNRCRRFGSDLFEIAVPFAQVVCMSGREATELFYDPTRFERKGAIPKRVQKTLLKVRSTPPTTAPTGTVRKCSCR